MRERELAFQPYSRMVGKSWPQRARQLSILAVTLGEPSHFSEHQCYQLFDMNNELDKLLRMK